MKKRWTALLLALALGASLGLSVLAAETGEKPAEDAAQLRFETVEGQMRRNNLQILTLDLQIDALEDVDYEEAEQDLRNALNAIASVQDVMLGMGQGSSYAYDKMNDSYSALRQQFDAIRNGDLQSDNAALIRQLSNLEDQLVLGGEAMYLALLSMESQEESLRRQLTALDRQLQELRLRYQLGQISALTLKEAEAGRASLASGLDTLSMNIGVYKIQLEAMLGMETAGTLRLSAAPRVTAAQLGAMDLERDLAAAKERSYELFDAKSTYDKTRDAYHGLGSYTPSLSAERGWPAAQYTYRNTVQNFEVKFRALYAQVKDYRQVLDAAKTALESKKASCRASELKYEQGTISKNALLTAQEDVSAAETAVRDAETNLFTAYNNYRWAVEKGILN